MSNNSISTIVEQQTITSKEIAEITGKNHSDVLRVIRKMEPAWEEVHKSKFAWKQNMVDTFNGAKRPIPCCVLTKTECLFVATKFNDVARAKLVLRWEQLEKGEKREDLVPPLQRDFLRKQQALRVPLEEFKAFHRKDVVEFCEDAANKLKIELTTSRFYYLTCIYLDIVQHSKQTKQ